MGNNESATPGDEPVGDSQLQHYSQMFRELTAPDHTGHPIDDKIFRVSRHLVTEHAARGWMSLAVATDLRTKNGKVWPARLGVDSRYIIIFVSSIHVALSKTIQL